MDPLTFLPNRRMILRELQDEVLRAERYHTQFSISLVDVDHFKKVNDSYGHLTGDEVLKQVGTKLKDQIRHPDLAGRYGGEEFLILLPNSDSKAAAEQAARLCRQLRDMVVQAHNHALQVTISIGIAEYEFGVDTWESLLNRDYAVVFATLYILSLVGRGAGRLAASRHDARLARIAVGKSAAVPGRARAHARRRGAIGVARGAPGRRGVARHGVSAGRAPGRHAQAVSVSRRRWPTESCIS